MKSFFTRDSWERDSGVPWFAVGVVMTVLGLVLFGIGHSAGGATCVSPTRQGRLKMISADDHTVVMAVESEVKTFSGANVSSALTNFGPNDTVCFLASGDPKQTQQLDAIAPAQVKVRWPRVMGALALAVAVVWWMMFLITGGSPLGLRARSRPTPQQ